jgi:hypothetical protein
VTEQNRTPYERQWREYRRLRRLAVFLWLGWMPYGAAVLALTRPFQSPTPKLGIVSGWILILAIAGAQQGSFRCPRCGEKFFSKGWYHNGLSSSCLHCQLPKWAGSIGHPLG